MMYRQFRYNKESSIIPFIIALNGFLLMNPYFVWNTYSISCNYLMSLFFIVTLAIQALWILRYHFQKKTLYLVILFVFYYLYILVNSFQVNINSYLKIGGVFTQIIFFVMLPIKERKATYKIFTYIFATSLVLPIIIWCCIQLKCLIPYNELQSESYLKSSEGYYYKQYFGAVFLDNYLHPNSLYRLCGVFDEPGVVGTTAGILLTAENGNMKKANNWIILVGGIISFSLAFVGLVTCFIGIKILAGFIKRRKEKKQVAVVLIVLLVGALISPRIVQSDYVKSYVINKIHRTVNKDSRNTEGFQKNYNEMLASGTIRRYLFGYGYGATSLTPEMAGSNSYKIQIYDLGLIGFISLYWIIYYAAVLEGGKKAFAVKILLIIFCISTYQRISVFTVTNFILLVGGSDYLEYKKENTNGNNVCSCDI